MKKSCCIILLFVFLLAVSLFSGCGCEHSELTKIKDTATCESDGIITYRCKQCDKTIEKTSPKKEHDYSIIVNDSSTCEKSGEIKNKCSRCGFIKSTLKKATGHNGTLKCTNCNKNFYILLYSNLETKTFSDNTSVPYSTSTVKYSKVNNASLCITWTTSYGTPLDYDSTTVFTIKEDGTWAYSINGAFTGYVTSSGKLTGELPYNKLYLYTSRNVTNVSIELPISSSNNNNMTEALYTELKTNFCTSLRLLESACIVNGKITMKNLGFINY